MLREARRLVLTIAAGTVLLAFPTTASANWLTIKNETGKAIIVQEVVLVKGETRRGKATNLLPGETVRMFLPAPATKRVEVFEPRNTDRAVWSGHLECKDEAQAFSVTSAGGKVTVSSSTPPKQK